MAIKYCPKCDALMARTNYERFDICPRCGETLRRPRRDVKARLTLAATHKATLSEEWKRLIHAADAKYKERPRYHV